jgi:hypothetical protein
MELTNQVNSARRRLEETRSLEGRWKRRGRLQPQDAGYLETRMLLGSLVLTWDCRFPMGIVNRTKEGAATILQ